MTVDIATLAIRIDSLEARNARRDLDGMRDAGGRAETQTRSLTQGFSGLAATLKIMAIAALAKEFLDAADAMASMDARLKLATKSMEEFAQAQRDVYKIAQANSLGIIEAATLYTKLAEPVRNLGGTARETAAIVDSFATSLRISGAATQEAAAATMQFAQAMGSGKLSGDEFRSMAETSPRFMKAMADGMGVPIGTLKEMAGEGRLTADVVGNALIKALAEMQKEVATIPQTVGGAFTQLKNDVMISIAEINKASTTSLGFVELIESARKLIPVIREELVDAFKQVAAFIERNRADIVEIWDVAKGLTGDVWEIAKAAASVAQFFFESTEQASYMKIVLETARLLVAGLQDGVKIIGASFAWVGSMIMQAVVGPLQLVLAASAKVAGLFNEDLGTKISGISQQIRDFTSAGQAYANNTFSAFADGDSAVVRLNKSMADAKTTTDSAAASAAGAEGAFKKLKAAVTGPSDKDVKAANAGLDNQRKLMADLVGVNGDYMAQLTRLQGLRSSLNMSEERYVELVTELIAKQPMAKKLMDEATKAMREEADAAKKSADAYEERAEKLSKVTDQLVADALAQQDHNDKIGLSKEAIAVLDAQRFEHLASLKDEKADLADLVDLSGQMAAEYRAQAQALRDRADATRLGGLKEANLEIVKEYQKTSDTIEKSLTDALLRGFESGKGFGRNLVDTLKNMFSTLVLRPIISAVVNPVAGAISGALGIGGSAQPTGAGASPASILSMGQQLWKGFSGTGGAGGATAGSGMLASVTPYIPMVAVAVASYMGAKAVAGDFRIKGIGNALNFLGIAGGVLNRAFGMGNKETGATTLNGSFGAGGFSGTSDTAWTQKGGWFRSDKSGVDKAAIDAEMAKNFTAGYDALKASSADFAKALGINADSIATRAQTMSVVLTKDAAENEKAIAAFFVRVGDDIARELVPSLDQFTKAGETASATLQRIATDYVAVTETLRAIGMTFAQVGVESIAARERLIDLVGGVEKFTTSAGFFQQNFLSEAERLAPVQKQVADEMAKLGLAGVETRDQFKDVVLGLDLTTEKGATTYAALMRVQEAFAMIHPAAEAATEALATQVAFMDSMNRPAAAGAGDGGGGGGGALTEEGMTRWFYAMVAQRQAEAAAKLKSVWTDLTDSIFDEVKRIRGLLVDSGPAGFAQVQAQFATATAQARAGDQSAAALLPKLSQTMLQLAEVNSATVIDLQLLRASTAASLYDTGRLGAGKFGLSIPGFASGGDFMGGLRIVGENGPELEATGPSRIFNASQTARMMGGDNSDLIAAVERLTERVDAFHADNSRENVQAIKHGQRTADTLEAAAIGEVPLATKETA